MKYFISLKSTSLSENEKTLLQHSDVCGVILYGRNILSLETTQNLIRKIKAVNSDLKIAVDEEGGIVSRFTHLIKNFSQPYIATLPRDEVKKYYKQRSESLRNIGIDLNFAPVVDIALHEKSYMYKRSYGSNLDRVIELATICIEEQQKAGISTCIKHFPGHGRSVEDSHEELPVVNVSKEEWESTEGKIFQALIENGVEYIMIGHLLFPKISHEVSSISSYWIRQVLRDTLGFKGKIIADDLSMKGFSESVKDLTSSLLDNAGLDEAIITELDHKLLG